MKDSEFSTLQILLIGLIVGILMNVPFYSWVFNVGIPVFSDAPFSWISAGIGYIVICIKSCTSLSYALIKFT